MEDTNRRQFLQVAGVTGGLGLAGCLDDDDNGDTTAPGDDAVDSTGDATDDDQDTDVSGDHQVAIVVQIDQAALQQRQRELQAELQDGQIDEAEFQAEIQSFQEELVEDGIETFESEAAEGLQIDERFPLQQALRVSGTGDDLIESLAYESVAGIVDAAQLDQEPAGP